MGAAAMELDRIGWAWPSPFVFQNHLGETISLVKVPPSRVMQAMADRQSELLQQRLGQRAGIPEGVDPAPARAALRSKKFDERGKAIISSVWAGALWTNVDLEKAGYIVDCKCWEIC